MAGLLLNNKRSVMWKYMVALVFFGHGMAHVSGVLASWTSTDVGFAPKPWIFSSHVELQSPVGKIFGLLWLVALIGFVLTAVGIVMGRPALLSFFHIAAMLSLLTIVVWWNAVPAGAKLGAAFDVLLLVISGSALRQRFVEWIV